MQLPYAGLLYSRPCSVYRLRPVKVARSRLLPHACSYCCCASAQAVGDDDEWVRVIGRAMGGFSGSLDLDAVVSESRLVTTQMNKSMHVLTSCPAA